MSKRVSLQDIAAELSLSKMTVSLALRKHPRISSATRERVEKTAARMGYRPNPEVAQFMSAIRKRQSSECGLPLAYLTTGEQRGIWKDSYTELGYWRGACARASEYGYYLEEYWMDEPHMSQERISDILWNRGIIGVILPPLMRTLSDKSHRLSLQLNWDHFTTVTISDMLADPVLHRVTHDHYTSMLTAMDALISKGYRRIGLCMIEHMDLTVNQRWQAGYRVYRANHPIERIEPLILPELTPSLVEKWAVKNKLDAIVGAERRMPRFFREIGWKMGKDIAYADMDLNPDDSEYSNLSGIVQNSDMMGRAAVDLAISGIQRNERGVPKIPLVLQVEGSWVDSASTPKSSRKSAKKHAIPAARSKSSIVNRKATR